MDQIIDRKRYDTATATLLASDRYWDGSNHDRRGRNTALYRTAKGAYFAHYTTQWAGERDRLEALTPEAALDLYTGPLCEHALPLEEAFGPLAATIVEA